MSEVTAEAGGTEGVVRLRQDAVSWRRMVDGEIVGLHLQSSGYLRVNITGSVLWQALAEGSTRTQLVSLVSGRFEIDRERAAHDVDLFLTELANRGLLKEDSPS